MSSKAASRSVAAALLVCGCTAAAGPVLFQESFDTPELARRGWYDGANASLSTVERIGTSGSSIEYAFAAGATKPAAGSPLRHKFAPTDAVYLGYSVKYSPNWVGSQRPYHPHEFHFLTTVDDDWSNLSFTHLTVYVEQNGGTPLLAIQDGKNVDQTRIGHDLAAATERRAAAGCNGSSDGFRDNCYRVGGDFVNEKKWNAAAKAFGDAKWHAVEAFVKLNTVAGGKGMKDGVIRYWIDQQLVIDHSNVLLRTGANPSMKFNQLVIAPYIGDGSPIAQTMWIDNLVVATARP